MQKTMPINEKLIATASPDSAPENKGETDFSPYIKPVTSLIIPSAKVKKQNHSRIFITPECTDLSFFEKLRSNPTEQLATNNIELKHIELKNSHYYSSLKKYKTLLNT